MKSDAHKIETLLAGIHEALSAMENIKLGNSQAEQEAAAKQTAAIQAKIAANGFRLAHGLLTDINRIAYALEQIAENGKPAQLMAAPASESMSVSFTDDHKS